MALCKTFRTVSDIAKQDIKRHGLNLTEFEVLELLASKGPQAIQDIGKQVLLTSGTMTYVVDKLAEKGLVQRKNSTKDKRVVFAKITPAGKELLEALLPTYAECVRGIFKELSPAETQEMNEHLNKLAKLQKA